MTPPDNGGLAQGIPYIGEHERIIPIDGVPVYLFIYSREWISKATWEEKTIRAGYTCYTPQEAVAGIRCMKEPIVIRDGPTWIITFSP